MDECKNRAPGSLEWKGGDKPIIKWEDAYRAWTDTHDLSVRRRMRQNMAFVKTFERGWDMRQPEIDALKAENEKLRKDAVRLRNAAKPVIDYWFEEDETRTQESDGAAFLELSNAYYKRQNRFT
jgi:hypothetical protein